MIKKEKYIARALLQLVPNAKFALRGDSLDHLEWLDERPQPSAQQIDAKLNDIVAGFPMQHLKDIRNGLLKQSDWLAVADRTMSDEEQAYRQALRDLPANNPNPTITEDGKLGNVNWPTAPAILGSVSHDFQL